MASYPFSVTCLSEAHLQGADLEKPAPLADRAAELTRENRQLGYHAWALRMQGEIAAHPARLDVETAEIRYREASALATELGMRPLIAHCHLGLGKLYHRTDKREQALEHLTTATTMYREMA
jgi:hypothetical protein